MMLNPDVLIPFCTTDRQREIIEEIKTAPTITQAAKNVNAAHQGLAVAATAHRHRAGAAGAH